MSGRHVDSPTNESRIVELDDGLITATDVGGFVTTVEFDRGPFSFFDVELIQALSELLEELATVPEVRAVVLGSAGKHFCAGAKLAPKDGSGRHDAYVPHLYDAAARLIRQPLPVVAAVQGRAVGGGLGLALACDFRVASSDATFDSAFARLGIHHGFGVTVTLPDAIGDVPARRLLYQQIAVDADEALALGLCQQVVPRQDLWTAAVEFARPIAAAAPLAVRSIRQTMRQDLVARYDAAVQRERMAQGLLKETTDAVEGITAQRQRRAPNFIGQ